VYVRTKSYSETNAEELALTATETQGDSSKGVEEEETARMFKLKCHQKKLEQCSIDMKWLIARNTCKTKTKTGSYEGFSEKYVQEVLELFTSHQDKKPMEETRQPQDHLGITGPEALASTGLQGLPFQSHKTFHSYKDARLQDAPEAMGTFFSHEQMQEEMTCPKEAQGNSQYSGNSTTPEAMVKFGQTIPPSPALAISLFPQDAKTQDATESMVKFSSHEQLQEQITLPKEAHGIYIESRYNTAPEDMVKYGQTSPPSQSLATSPLSQDAINQDAPEAMPKSEGRNIMAEPMWNILQNKAAKVVDHEITTMKDSNTIMQQEGWTKDNDCETSASQLRKYGANNLLLSPLLEPLQRPSTPVRVSESMDEAPETPNTTNVIQPLVKNSVPPQVIQLSTFERSGMTTYDPLSTFNPKKWLDPAPMQFQHRTVKRTFMAYVAVRISVNKPSGKKGTPNVREALTLVMDQVKIILNNLQIVDPSFIFLPRKAKDRVGVELDLIATAEHIHDNYEIHAQVFPSVLY
jgi:hypothetical protein